MRKQGNIGKIVAYIAIDLSFNAANIGVTASSVSLDNTSIDF